MVKKNPLLDEIFLQQLYLDRHKEIYAKIIALNQEEEPIEQIEGQVTGGSVSLDGSSNVRRSCSLTMIAYEMDINAYYWGLKNKFKLFIGLSNHIDENYEDIIWFPFGVMLITNFSTSQSTNGYNVSISGKDKMCLLNGELSGSLFASVDFGKQEYYDSETKITTFSDIPIKQIIREAVHEYAQEPWDNIVINDLDDYGLELLDYKGSRPLYLIIDESRGSNEDLGDVVQITLDGVNTQLFLNGNEAISLENISRYNPRTNLNAEGADIGEYDHFSWERYGDPVLSVVKVEHGQTCGYRYTDITYAGDLILGVGEPITSMLDKLIQMLGNWEYFYDVDGRFIFQRKKTYLDKTWNNIITNNDNSYVPTMGETYVESALWSSAVTWNFADGFLVTAFNNSPVLSNIRNDYSIWGTKKSIDGTEFQVHLRYAIDKKPSYYKTFEGIEWTTENDEWWIRDGESGTTFEELKRMIIEEEKQRRVTVIMNQLKKFSPTRPVPGTAPKKIKFGKNAGAFTPGWWDIEDWYEYYKIVYEGAEPTELMRTYATPNDETGYSFLNLKELYGLESWKETRPLWLFDVYEYADGTFKCETMHNGGGSSAASVHGGCSMHNFQYFLDNVIAYNTAAAQGVYRQIDGKDVVAAHTYFYNPAISQTVQSNQSGFVDFIVEEIETDFTDEEITNIIIQKGYYKVSRKNCNHCDWREIIFQMAKDYRKYGHYTPYDPNDGKEHPFSNEALLDIAENFNTKIRENSGKNRDGNWYYPTGKTGYEQYYTDLEGFWRQLYCPPVILETQDYTKTGVWTDRPTTEDPNYYTVTDGVLTNADKTNILYFLSVNWKLNGDASKDGWNMQVIESPATLNFWFDFLDADKDSDFAKYSVPVIGDRAKSVNDNMVKAIYFREVPNTIFTKDLLHTQRKSGYTYMQYQENMSNLFTVSTQGKCAIDVMEEWINNYIYAIESTSITTVPIYHLQPNTRIKIMDKDSHINGDYIVSRISIPLAYNGTMSITATKVADRVY